MSNKFCKVAKHLARGNVTWHIIRTPRNISGIAYRYDFKKDA